MDASQLNALWAKFDRDSGTTLPLAQHMIDSADVARKIWSRHTAPALCAWLAEKTGLHAQDLENVVAWCVGTHDIGKATVSFQTQIESQPYGDSVVSRLRHAGFQLPRLRTPGSKIPHSHLSNVFISDYLQVRFGYGRRQSAGVAAISGAHHGIPTFNVDRSDARTAARQEGDAWEESRTALFEHITEYTDAAHALTCLRENSFDVPAQLILTGLTIESDWIASNADLFPIDKVAEDRFQTAWENLHLPRGWNPPEDHSNSAADFYRSRFDWPNDRLPHATQAEVFNLSHKDDVPNLVCIEAAMGAGKTESALAMAEVLARRCQRSGVFIAAPTMSTSDGLFSRVQQWGSRVTPHHGITSMYLGHSKNSLNEDFVRLRRSNYQSSIGEDQYSSGQGSVVAHQWLSGRKKGILSDFVVGTVDQLLFAALQSRHVMLRHLGLAQKVVIIDEVHAYDAYMQSYLQAALTWLGAYGVPVILLSATLPPTIKNSLLQSYRQGLNSKNSSTPPGIQDTSGYPLVTYVSADGQVSTISIDETTPLVEVSLEVIDDSIWSLLSTLASYDENGGCILVLCTTVFRAQEVFTALRQEFGDSVQLLHAGFTATSRSEHEARLREELGPTSRRGSGRPFKRLLVSTQVVEQSLDVDFDLIVTDFAPTDLLLQRIGRLHRHPRPASDRPRWTSAPRTLIRGMTSITTPGRPPDFEDTIKLIYSTYVLLRSWWALRSQLAGQRLSLPDQIPRLVSSTYSEDGSCFPGFDDAVATAKTLHDAELRQGANRAASFQLKLREHQKTIADAFAAPSMDFERSGANSEPLGSAVVRDSIPSIEVILVRRDSSGYGVLPWVIGGREYQRYSPDQAIDEAVARLLATCSVRLPHRFGKEPLFSVALDELERQSYTGWKHSRFLNGLLTLELDDDYSSTIAGNQFKYDRYLGLVDLSVHRPHSAASAGE